MYFIKIIGLPGSGKSTMIENWIKKNPGKKFLTINDRLTNEKDRLALNENRTQNCYIFQKKMIEKYEVKTAKNHMNFDFIINHTPLEMITFFNEVNLKQGFLTKYGWEELISHSVKKFKRESKPDLTVYMITTPQICAEHIEQRKRTGETCSDSDSVLSIKTLTEVYEKIQIHLKKLQEISQKQTKNIFLNEFCVETTNICDIVKYF